MLSHTRGTRLVYEPANLPAKIFDGVQSAHVEIPLPTSVAERDAVLRAIDGTMHHPWTDQFNHAHVVKRSVIKDVRAISLCPSIRRARSGTPIIVLVRHPFAVAYSALRLGWTDTRDRDNAFVAEVLSWCQRHSQAFRDPDMTNIHYVTYEDLVKDTQSELQSILIYASQFHSTWNHVRVNDIEVNVPSATTFGSPESRHDAVTQSATDSAYQLLVDYELSDLYAKDLTCRSDVGEFVRAFRDRHTGNSKSVG